MATANEGECWFCDTSNCGAFNKCSNYRCWKCNVVKPYLLTSSQSAPEEVGSAEPEVTGETALYDVTSSWQVYGAASSGARPKTVHQQVSTSGHEDDRIEVPVSPSTVGGDRLHEEVIEFPDQECRVVIMGKTGNGKSSTGNTILNLWGRDSVNGFKTGKAMKSTTVKCQWRSVQRFGVKMEVVDTPGFFDTEHNDVEITKEISRCIGIVCHGPHALLLAVRLSVKFTPEEEKAVRQLRGLFGDDIMRHVVIVFTHGDWLESDISSFLSDCPSSLKSILEEIENRYVVFDNKETDQAKRQRMVKELLLTIRRMVSKTDRAAFSSTFLRQCEQIVLGKARRLADLVNSDMSEHHRDLIRAGLVSKDRLQEILHEVLDESQNAEEEKRSLSAMYDIAIETQEQLETALEAEQCRRMKAEKTRDELKKERDELKRKLDKKWSCQII